MTSKSWDPLVQGQQADTEIIAAAQKRYIRNILKSYVGMYDSFSELIQNAMDAVDKREYSEDASGYEKRIWLNIDLVGNCFSIIDNGIGFNEKEFETFLAPNISFKDGEKTRGNKGVGATYIAYGFNHLEFATKSPNHSFSGEISGGRKWVDDDKGVVTRPVVNEHENDSEFFENIERGSYFKITFGGDNTRPKKLSWYTANSAEQWLYLLLIRTPLGLISNLTTQTDIKFNLSVIDSSGNLTELNNQDAVYIYPHTKIKASTNLKDVLEHQSKLVKAKKDASVIPKKYTKSNGIFEFFTTDELILLSKRNIDVTGIVKKHSMEAYAYFTYSTTVWDQFNDVLAKLRKGYRVLKGGLQLANNGMIQGDMLVIPLTSNTGYQNQCHVVIHLLDADPDLGRKGFQPELKEAAEYLSVMIVNRFKKWRSLLKSDTGAKPDITKEIELHEWIKQQEEHERSHPLELTNKNFFAPIYEISITSVPQSEQDVIVLFNQLIAGGVIRGLKLLATSQVKQYDGVYKFVIKYPLENHEYDKSSNPLGVEELHFKEEHTSPPKVLEYKYNIDALIHEFETEYKSEKDIHLAIAWELGDEWRKKYEATSLLDLENLHQRDFHGLTHILDSGTTKFYVIALRELLEYLNDVDGVQKYHQEKYSEALFD